VGSRFLIYVTFARALAAVQFFTTSSYLSQSKKKVVHNLVKFQQGEAVVVDDRPFSATGLDDVVNKIQSRLKGWRGYVPFFSLSFLVDKGHPATRRLLGGAGRTLFGARSMGLASFDSPLNVHFHLANGTWMCRGGDNVTACACVRV
jgi:hypothetical protein